ncbi:D-glucuronyl C5-epimerase family protein [Vibrio sp. T20]|uniref:D-glucuronyl C5-epimerase family protein n=1 Tax=Vibrio sp. T20 TaxID=2588450 RepID=UPI0011B3FA2B|nr:D-glucuronyl C5-epimerase family protein [Vibrio sp. T20]
MLKKFIKKAYRDFTNPLKYTLSSEEELEMGYYYFKFSTKELLAGGSQDFSFDEQGIPIIPHYMSNCNKKHYYPISIGQYGLAVLHDYFSGDEAAFKQFINIADWFLANQTEDGYWLSYTDMSKFELEMPWTSAMTQGRAISLLTRAYRITGDHRYLDASIKAFSTFKQTSCPFVTKLSEDKYFYQEYPGKKESNVLNGMVFCMWGLYDLFDVTKDKEVKEYFDKGINAVVDKIEEYDINGWSIYDLFHKSTGSPINYCTAHYHDIHIKQLRVLGSLTNNQALVHKSEVWSSNATKNKLLIAYYNKIKVLVFRRK